MNDASAATMVNERWKLADDGRKEYADRAIENEMLYQGVIDENSHPYLSNICLPWPYIIVESYLGKCVQMLAATMPYVRVVENDNTSRDKAKRVEKDANMTLYLQKWPILAYLLYKQAFKYPAGFIEIKPWGRVEGREMPVFKVRNFFRTWVNPTSVDDDDPDFYAITIDYVPVWVLQKLKGNKTYKNISKIELYDGNIYTPEEQEIQAFKKIPTKQTDPYSKLVKVTQYFSHNDIIVTTNDTNVIRNEPSNFLGMIPIRRVTALPQEDEYYGMAILEEGKSLFENINENENQYNDAVNLMLNPQWIISRNADIRKSTIVARSGGILYTDDVNGVVPMRVDWNLLTASLNRKAKIEGDIQNYSNAFPQMRGAPQQGTETATEYMGMRSAGELRSDTYNLLLSMISVEQMVRDIVYLKQMFMTDPSSFYYWPEDKGNTATLADYSGDFAYRAMAQYKMSREIDRKQLIEAMTMVFGNQAFLPLVINKGGEWLARLLDYFDIRDADSLYDSPEQAQMNQLMQMMGSIGGPGGPGGNPQLPGTSPALGEKEMRMPEQTPNPPMMGDIGAMMGGIA